MKALFEKINSAISSLGREKVILISVGLLLSVIFWIIVDFLRAGSQIVGVQIITKEGTYIVARDKYFKNLVGWFSPRIGKFAKSGSPIFFEKCQQSDETEKVSWSIKWKWQDLYTTGKGKKAFLSLAPRNKNSAIETLTKNCTLENQKDDLTKSSCNWYTDKKISIESLTDNFICLNESAEEFYGGAHPLIYNRFRNFDLSSAKEINFQDLLGSQVLQEQVLRNLYANLNLALSYAQQAGAENLENPDGDISIGEPVMPSLPPDAIDPDLPLDERIRSLLSQKGYYFDPNSVCLSMNTDGPCLLFSFPALDQASSGSNLRVDVPLTQSGLPEKVNSSFRELLFREQKGEPISKIQSPDGRWAVLRGIQKVTVSNSSSERTSFDVKLKSNDTESIVGIFWIYRAPSPASLEKYSFKPVRRV